MTSTRLRTVLTLLHWSQNALADILGCSDRLVRMWANAEAPVPPEVGVWLEATLTAFQACTPPSSFRRPGGRPIGS